MHYSSLAYLPITYLGTRPRRFAGFGVIRAEEFLEHLLLIFNGHTNAIVLDPKMDHTYCAFRVPMIRGLFHANLNGTALGCVFVGIADQIHQHLTDTDTIRPHERDLFRQGGFEGLFLIFNLALERA